MRNMSMLCRVALFAYVTLFMPAWAQSSTPAPVSAPERDIVVTGVPLKVTQARLAACLARKCPAKEDIDATLAHAENAFVAGDYKMARKTLLASLGRNRRYAKTLPLDVADLLRASSRVAAHLGEKQSYIIAATDAMRVLRQGLADGDSRVLDARIEVGDSRARTDDISTAVDMYRDVARDARRYELPTTEGYARLRIVALYAALAEDNPSFRPTADREAKALIDNGDPRLGQFAAAAAVIRARTAAKNGDMTAVDRFVADAKQAGQPTPVLVYAPPIGRDKRAALPGGNMARVQMNSVDKQWVDIGLWIDKDGKVSDVAILRQSPSLSGNWPQRVITSISGRRYSAFTPAFGATGMQRVERYTLTALWTTDTGTHMRVRESVPRIEMLDLTG